MSDEKDWELIYCHIGEINVLSLFHSLWKQLSYSEAWIKQFGLDIIPWYSSSVKSFIIVQFSYHCLRYWHCSWPLSPIRVTKNLVGCTLSWHKNQTVAIIWHQFKPLQPSKADVADWYNSTTQHVITTYIYIALSVKKTSNHVMDHFCSTKAQLLLECSGVVATY